MFTFCFKLESAAGKEGGTIVKLTEVNGVNGNYKHKDSIDGLPLKICHLPFRHKVAV